MEELIPRYRVEVCGIPYDIIECEDSFDSDSTHFGIVRHTDCTIHLNSNLVPEMKNQTLCHEIVHAMLTNLGYNEYSADEQFVQALAMAINQSFVVKVHPVR